MMKKLVAVMAVGALALGIAATSEAAPIITINPNPCPTGWQLVKNSKNGDNYACQPVKTKQMVQCPVGLEYYDNGCSIGCRVPVN